MDALRPFVDFLAGHTFAIVFLVTLIDAFGLPFPGRLLLIVSGAFMETGSDAAVLILIAASGALLGDHGVYLAGRMAGSRILGLLCRVTLNAEGCLEKTREYLRRFGAPTFVLGRFVAGIRIAAITLAGAGLVRYRTFLLYDVAGVLVWASTCVLLGYAVRDHWTAFVETYGSAPVAGIVVVGSVTAAIVCRIVWRSTHRARAHSA
jgi:membrane protein DedA with SNARE-associated domain